MKYNNSKGKKETEAKISSFPTNTEKPHKLHALK